MTLVPNIDVVNESTLVTAATTSQILKALQIQVHDDFRPEWNTGCRLAQTTRVGASSWGLVILDDADQAGALGYHDLTAAGLPLAKVFARTTQEDGGEVSVVCSHELLEMLADPWIDAAVQVGETSFYALEVCDACEGDQFGYEIGGVLVSDFVLPTWFRSDAAGPYDFRGKITQPLSLLAGGYIGEWTPSVGWTQKTADDTAPPSRRIPLRQRKHAGAVIERSTR